MQGAIRRPGCAGESKACRICDLSVLPYLNSIHVLGIVDIPLPLAHIGSVNAWLLRGDPLTLLDTGPRDDAALAALEAGLRREGLRIEDIELVLATHHHLDHVGLAATIKRRSGAVVAALDRVADYAERYHAEVEHDRRFARALMAHHGVPVRRHRGP